MKERITAADEKEIKIIQKNGLEQRQVQLVLQYYLENDKTLYIPDWSLISETLPLEQLKKLGKKQIAFTFGIKNEHQVLVYIELNSPPTIKIMDSLKEQDTNSYQYNKNAVDKQLKLLLGADNIEVTAIQSPFTPQSDQWSCGIYVIEHLLHLRNKNTLEQKQQEKLIALNTNNLLREHYLAYKDREMVDELKQQQITKNEKNKQKLLEIVEKIRFENKKSLDEKDLFQPIADFLQLNIWGNVNRGTSPSENKGRTKQITESQRAHSLEELIRFYEKQSSAKNKELDTRFIVGRSLLQLASQFPENLETLIPLFMFQQMNLLEKENSLEELNSFITQAKFIGTQQNAKVMPGTTDLFSLLNGEIGSLNQEELRKVIQFLLSNKVPEYNVLMQTINFDNNNLEKFNMLKKTFEQSVPKDDFLKLVNLLILLGYDKTNILEMLSGIQNNYLNRKTNIADSKLFELITEKNYQDLYAVSFPVLFLKLLKSAVSQSYTYNSSQEADEKRLHAEKIKKRELLEK